VLVDLNLDVAREKLSKSDFPESSYDLVQADVRKEEDAIRYTEVTARIGGACKLALFLTRSPSACSPQVWEARHCDPQRRRMSTPDALDRCKCGRGRLCQSSKHYSA
jgi:hypothetical protein